MVARDPVLTKAFQLRGAVKRTALACGISTQAVSQWRRVPEDQIMVVSRVLGIPVEQLRPDIFRAAE